LEGEAKGEGDEIETGSSESTFELAKIGGLDEDDIDETRSSVLKGRSG